MARMFVLDLTYIAELDAIDAHMEGHRAYLARNYENGAFLASGRKDPRTGGVIIATGDRAEIESVVADDPFSVHHVAEYRITEFLPTMTAPALADLQEPMPR